MFRRLLCLMCLDDPAKELCHQNHVGLPRFSAVFTCEAGKRIRQQWLLSGASGLIAYPPGLHRCRPLR
jgi:hypothetical protein